MSCDKTEVDFLRNELLHSDKKAYLLLDGLHGSGKSTILKLSLPVAYPGGGGGGARGARAPPLAPGSVYIYMQRINL